MINTFNKIKYNIKKLKPRAEDIVLNKCTHAIFCKEDGKCASCKTTVDPNVCLNETELNYAVEVIVNHLECMKMITNICMSKKEIRAAKKYFKMIPLLKNLYILYDICNDEMQSTDLNVVDLHEPLKHDTGIAVMYHDGHIEKWLDDEPKLKIVEGNTIKKPEATNNE